MKKLILLLAFLAFLISIVPAAFAITCTQNVPWNNKYDNGLIVLNTTATLGDNVTNVTWTIGTSVFTNSTINGTKTSATAGDFTFTLVAGSLSEGSYTAYSTCYNETEYSNALIAQNSSSVTYVKDTTNPSIVINEPIRGSTVVPSNNLVTFKYTPTEANLGNCSLSIDNALIKSSTSGTTTSNVTSGKENSFVYGFTADSSNVRVAINCKDLVGRYSPSDTSRNNFTFNVLIGTVPYAVKQLQASGGGYLQPSGKAHIAASLPSTRQAATHLQRYAWLYLIVFVVIVIFAFKKLK